MPLIAPFAPSILLPTFTLPNALPGAAQWVSQFPFPGSGATLLRYVSFAGIAAADVTMHLVPPGGTAVASNIVIPASTIPAKYVMDWYFDDDIGATVTAGYSIFLFASVAAAVNATIWGADVS